MKALAAVENGLPRIITIWFVVALLASALRIMVSPLSAAPDLSTVMPYVLLVGAPLVSLGLALIWFADADRHLRPRRSFAFIGRWRDVSLAEASAHKFYGNGGIMVSLLVGMLLNVPVRAVEYLAAMPALAGSIPHWLSTLRLAMTFDVVLLTSLYTIAFVAALRRSPLFPRLLVSVWVVDIAVQLGIAVAVTTTGDLPPGVSAALQDLLNGNIKKVLISAGVWLPYLLLSQRVNVTFRRRVVAD